MGKIEHQANRISKLLDGLAQFTLVVLVLLVVVNVVLRVALGSPILGTYELPRGNLVKSR